MTPQVVGGILRWAAIHNAWAHHLAGTPIDAAVYQSGYRSDKERSQAGGRDQISRRLCSMVDILILGGTVVTLDADRRRINDGAVAITGDRISHVGTNRELQHLNADVILRA